MRMKTEPVTPRYCRPRQQPQGYRVDQIRRLRVLFASAATVAFAACGGGGGSSSGSGCVDVNSNGCVAPSPSPSTPSPPAPATSETGLSDPTLKLNDGINDVLMLVIEMRDAGMQAPGAGAATALADLTPDSSDLSAVPTCSGGGTLTATAKTGGDYTYTYTDCKSAGYTFNGTATVSSTASDKFDLSFTGLKVSGNSSPETIDGSLDCTVSTTAGTAAQCIAHYGDYKWGYDVAYTSGGAQGTHQCNCGNGSWNVTFKDFTSSSGTANVYATNGTAVVTRNGDKNFSATVEINGSIKSYDVELN